MAELTKSSVVTTVFGDRRVVMFEVNAPNTDSHAVTGLDYVTWVGVSNEDAVIAGQVTKNSNDGTAGTLNGAVYIKLSTGTDTVSVIAIGK